MAKTTTKAKTKRPEREKRDGKDGRPLLLSITIPPKDVPAFMAFHERSRIPHESTTALVLLRGGLLLETGAAAAAGEPGGAL